MGCLVGAAYPRRGPLRAPPPTHTHQTQHTTHTHTHTHTRTVSGHENCDERVNGQAAGGKLAAGKGQLGGGKEERNLRRGPCAPTRRSGDPRCCCGRAWQARQKWAESATGPLPQAFCWSKAAHLPRTWQHQTDAHQPQSDADRQQQRSERRPLRERREDDGLARLFNARLHCFAAARVEKSRHLQAASVAKRRLFQLKPVRTQASTPRADTRTASMALATWCAIRVSSAMRRRSPAGAGWIALPGPPLEPAIGTLPVAAIWAVNPCSTLLQRPGGCERDYSR